MNKPIVSVILPFYNAGETLGRAIQSIVNQTFQNFELILVDNNSADNSYAVALAFAEKDKRLTLLKEEKQGVAHAMNRGLKSARGHYFARMDADDISLPNRLQKQLDFMEQNPEIGLCGCQVKFAPHLDKSDGFEKFIQWSDEIITPDEIYKNRFVEIPVINPTIFFRKEIFNRFGGCIQGDFPEDYEMQLRYLDVGIQFAKLPKVLLEWHDYPTRLTRNDSRYSREAFFRVKAKYFSRWSKTHNPFHPNVWIWGAGRKTRQRAILLEEAGLKISGYFDVEPKKTSTKICLHYSEIPEPGKIFIVSMVGNYGARERIRNYLLIKKYSEGEDFMLMA